MINSTRLNVADIRPGLRTCSLKVRVIQELIRGKLREGGTEITVAEFLVGDKSGCIVIRVKNDALKKFQPNAVLELFRAQIEMINECFLRLDVDPPCEVHVLAPEEEVVVNMEKNVSEVEWQYVPEL
ncbi:uncharacterized protein VTP21DRAFT_4013 [Calcarisporiella thermophila]|uniref:uncharacterized protein n=1 Tax=Calcarisporiella thermophila TaxID=911321 RepID=UPI003742CE75